MTANSPHAGVQVGSAGNSRIMTAHLPHTAHDASHRACNYIREKETSASEFQMCRAHLTDSLNITNGADIRTHRRQAGTAGPAAFPIARFPGRQRGGRSTGAGLAG